MVDRLFWRAGFGPSEADRATWTGKAGRGRGRLAALDAGRASAASPGTDNGKPLDPTGDDTDLVLSWIDGMVRATNPFVERLTFFWHRHFANSRDSVSPPQLLMTQNDLFRRYADLAANPRRLVRDLAYEVTIDPSMLRYLTGEDNVKGAPNENYARELMELFTLGVTNAAGKPNYSENDVRAAGARRSPAGRSTTRTRTRCQQLLHPVALVQRPEDGLRQVRQLQPPRSAVDLVLADPPTRRSSSPKLWNEFIAAAARRGDAAEARSGPTPGAGCRSSRCSSRSSPTRRCSPRVSEPNMIKPPVVFVVGAMRALGAERHRHDGRRLPRRDGPAAVLPAERGGLGGRPVVAEHEHRAGAVRLRRGAARQTRRSTTCPARPPAAAYDRAYAAVGQPWLAPGTQTVLRDYAGRGRLERRERSHRAPARAARADARRPRRTGDVMRDQPATTSSAKIQRAALRRLRALGQPRHRPRADLGGADPGRGDGGLPRRRPEATARRRPARVPAQRRARRGVGLRGDAASAGNRSGRRRSPRRRSRRARASSASILNGGNDGLNTIVPVARPVRGLRGPARRTSPACSARRPAPASARPSCPAPARRSRSPTPASPAPATTATRKGFDTLYGDGTGGAGSDLAIFPAADYTPPNRSHFESRDYWFAGALAAAADRLARPLARRLRLAVEPAAGGLARLLAVQADPLRQGAGVRDRGPRRGVSFQVANTSVNANAEIAKLAAVPAGAGNEALARARAIYGLTVDVSRQLGGLSAGQPGVRLPADSDLSRKLQLAATLLGANLGTRIITIDWGSFDTHGDQVERAGPAARGALARARRVQGRPRRARHRAERRDDGVLRVRPAHRVQRLGRHRPRRRRPDAGQRLERARRPGRRAPGRERRRRRGDLVPITDFRTVYQALISEWLGGDPAAILPGGPFPGIHALRRRHAPDEVMRRAGAILVVIALAAIAAPPAASRLHRLHRPLPALPHSLTVDETEWSVRPRRPSSPPALVRFRPTTAARTSTTW